MPIQIVKRGKALHRLPGQVAIWHGMANRNGLLAAILENMRDPPRGLALAATGAHRTHGDHRLA